MKLPELKLRLKRAEKQFAEYRASGENNAWLYLGFTNLIQSIKEKIDEETDKEK